MRLGTAQHGMVQRGKVKLSKAQVVFGEGGWGGGGGYFLLDTDEDTLHISLGLLGKACIRA